MRQKLLVLGIVLNVWASMAVARQWTDGTGKHHVEAELVEVKDGTVVLKKADGTTLSIALGKLSAEDQAFARKQGLFTKNKREIVSTELPSTSGLGVRDGLKLLDTTLKRPLVVWIEDAQGKTAQETTLKISLAEAKRLKSLLQSADAFVMVLADELWLGFFFVQSPKKLEAAALRDALKAAEIPKSQPVSFYISGEKGVLLVSQKGSPKTTKCLGEK